MKSEQLIKMYLTNLKKVRAELQEQMYSEGLKKLNAMIETLEWVLNQK